MKPFSSCKQSPENLNYLVFLSKLAYLSNIFNNVNDLNTKFQQPEINIDMNITFLEPQLNRFDI